MLVHSKRVLDNGFVVAVIAGLSVGVALIVLFAVGFPQSMSPENNVPRVEDKTTNNREQVPDLHLVVKKDGKRYAGEEGSNCWTGVCEDYGTIIPRYTIAIDRGSEIKFEFVNFRMPDTFGVTIETVPPLAGCSTDNVTGQTSCGVPEDVFVPELTRLSNDFEYKVDVPDGLYTIAAGGNWQKEDQLEGDASYYYRVQVR